MAIEEITLFLVRHGYALLFAWVLADQLGIPVPVFPVLLGVGALADAGQFNLIMAIPLAALASLLGGQLWYEIGRRRGGAVLRTLCQVSLQPDTCVRRTEDLFVRHGRATLVWARFVPGLSAIVSPLPTDREIILFCNCPHEATSAHIARQLKNRGIQRVHPLTGGLEGWIQRGFPLSAPSPVKTDLP